MKTIIFFTLILTTALSYGQCFVKIVSGEQHTVAIADDGTLWGWGSNTSGECGFIPNQHLLSPTQIGTFNDWIDVDCGAYHTIALRSNGDVYTMGYNNSGQCGTGNTLNVPAPTLVGSNYTKVAAGKGYTSYAIKSDSTLWACGTNGGKFGNNTAPNSISFIQVNNGYKWIDIAGGLIHTIGLASTGEVLTTGSNGSGQLGYDSFGTNNVPVFINANTNGLNIVDVDAGANFSVALADDGTVYTFGENFFGQLGNGNTFSTYNWEIPTNFVGKNIEKIKAGYVDCMAMTDSLLYTWGQNDFMMSSTTVGTSLSPFEWSFVHPTIDASMGLFNSAFIIENEGVYNWGKNDRGNCGIGSTTNTYVPELNNATCGSMCNISQVSIDNVSACDPITNSYTVTFTTTYENAAPADSMVVGGFGMPTVRFPATGSPQTETITIDFDEINASFTLSVSLETYNPLYSNFSCVNPGIVNPWTAPAQCGASNCSIDLVSLTSQTACDPSTDTYTRSIAIYYTNGPPAGSIVVNSQVFSVGTSSPMFVTLTNLPADGNNVVYDIFYTDDLNCSFNDGTGWIAPVSCSTTGITDINYSKIKLFPNPAQNILNIESQELTEIAIINLIGEQLMKLKLTAGINTINLSSLPSGIYMIQTKNGATQKFIKQ
jgi:alpha-tubulin suppressor-like RCC1 family protein